MYTHFSFKKERFWRKMIIIWIICIMISRYAFASSKIQTQYGTIEGATISLPSGRNVDAFLGVPYAAPPIGRLRFAPPKPPKSWNKTLETKTLSKSCVQVVKDDLKQVVWWLAEEPESEDCLYLNVWRPGGKRTRNLPVMVWIPGGGFIAGTASTSLYDGSVLATENDVIVVSMNYRLDLFGFVYFNSSQVAENVGLQDQIMAIKWVKKNIQNFGGDPRRITLFGESMGAVSVGFHMVNSQVYDLFQNAILESGTVEYELGSQDKTMAYERSVKFAENIGCLDDDVQAMMSCLRKQNVEDLVKAKGAGILFEFTRSTLGPVRNGVQVPLDIKSAVQKLPPTKRKNVMVGNVPRDVGYLITCFLPQEQLTVDVNVTQEDMASLLTNLFQLEDRRLQNVVLQEYKDFEAAPNDTEQLKKQLAGLLSDVHFLCPGVRLAKDSDPDRSYYFYFNHKPSKPIKLPTPEWMEVIHGDEIPFVFGLPLDSNKGYTQDEVILSKKMMTFWTNFAKTGNPNGKGGEEFWPTALDSNGTFTYLVLDVTLATGTKLNERKCDFWQCVYPGLASIQKQLKDTQ